MGRKKMTILNLAGSLSEGLSFYLEKQGISLVQSATEDTDLTHILCRNVQRFSEIISQYGTVRRDIKIISLSQVEDLQHFVASNGKLIFDEAWFKTPVGHFILDKFFQDHGNIATSSVQPSFQEKGSFNVANPFSTGEYLDRMVHAAFQDGVSALSVKTYFDHLVMYLAGLKNIGKLGLPIEVIFGTYSDIFSVQVQFYSHGLRTKDLILNLSNNYSNSEETLLNIAVQSADFFDFTVLSEVNKSVITGLWTKSEKIKTRNRGLLISELSSTASLSQYPGSKASPFQVGDLDLSDISEKVVLPSDADVDADLMSLQNDSNFNGKSTRRATTSPQEIESLDFENNEEIQTNRLGPSESEGFQRVKGKSLSDQGEKVSNKKQSTKENDIFESLGNDQNETQDGLSSQENDFELDENFNIIKALKKFNPSESGSSRDQSKVKLDNDLSFINGKKDEKEIAQVVREKKKLSFEEEFNLVKGSKEEAELAEMIFGNPLTSENENILVKGKKALPESAQVLKKINTLSSADDDFTMVKGQKEKSDFSQIVKGNESFSLDDDVRIVKGTKDEVVTAQLIKGTKPKTGEILKLKFLEGQLPEETKQKINDYLIVKDRSIEDLNDSDIEAIGDPQLKKIVNSTKDEFLIVQPEEIVNAARPALDSTQRELENSLNSLRNENEHLKVKMKSLLSEVRILKDSRAQMSEIHNKAVKAAEEAVASPSLVDETAPLKDQLLQKLKGNSSFSEQDLTKLSGLLEKEGKLYRESKELEVRSKRLQIELNQKESFFMQELEKLQRQVKAKDLVVLKTKEGLSKLVQKKDEDISLLNFKLAQANKTITNSNSQGQALQIKELEKQILNHQKMIEIYKNKAIQKPTLSPEDEAAKEETRRQQLISIQLKNQLDLTRKELSRLQENSSRDSSIINILKSDKNKLEQMLKKATQETKKEDIVTSNSQQIVDQEMKKIKSLNEFYETQLRDSQTRQRALEAKLQEVVRNQKKEAISEDNGPKAKTSQLEDSVKKLSRDLLESRNQMADLKKEATKLRQEKTALQNLLENSKKSAEKSKGAAPKKIGSGGKAA
jgi:hypothetical protein